MTTLRIGSVAGNAREFQGFAIGTAAMSVSSDINWIIRGYGINQLLTEFGRIPDILGSIEVGKLADFVVIPVDYMTIPAEDIWKIEPEMTVIGGEIVYTRQAQEQK